MAKFDKEIQRLQEFLNSPSDMIETEVAVQKLENLMRLDGWEPGGLAKRIDALDASLAALTERFATLEANTELLEANFAALDTNFETLKHNFLLQSQRIDAIERPGPMGFGKPE